ncbi:MAG: hypothetical protein EOO46_00010 [Flavobacterium sp.]|nr:MAG: hypothetical protein EOO46_00010 [Flavobacterium sp.]
MEPNYIDPNNNLYEIIAIGESMRKCDNLHSLKRLYLEFENYQHPAVHFDFGRNFLIMGEKSISKKALIKGASFGTNFPSAFYNNLHIDSIGQCISDLLTQYPIANYSLALKASSLAYIYLSRCIELYPNRCYDSYRTRAVLFKDHENPMVMQAIVMEHMGLGVLIEPFIISDYYFAATAFQSPFENHYFDASRLHSNLEDITIAGRDADEYTLEEMAEIGGLRHLQLFKILERQAEQGIFNMTTVELEQMNR